MSEIKEVKNLVMNDKRKEIIKVLKTAENNKGLTLDEISEKVGFKVMTGTTNPMKEVGLLKVTETTTKATKVKRPVYTYKVVSDKPTNEKKVVLNDNRKKVIETLKGSPKPLTMDELTEKVGFKVSSGFFNPLIACGMVEKAGTIYKVTTNPKGRPVSRYVLDTEVLKRFEK